MSDCRQKSGEQGCSSDEELDDSVEPINKALQVPIYNRSTIYNVRVKGKLVGYVILKTYQILTCGRR